MINNSLLGSLCPWYSLELSMRISNLYQRNAEGVSHTALRQRPMADDSSNYRYAYLARIYVLILYSVHYYILQ